MTALTVPPRGPLTDALVAFLRACAPLVDQGWLVGDGESDPAAGWTGSGQPGKGTFVGGVVVSTLEAVPQQPQLSGQHSAWQMRYLLVSHGVSRSMADDIADTVRNCVIGFTPFEMVGWKAASASFDRLAPVVKAGSGDFPVWDLSDTLNITVNRRRA